MSIIIATSSVGNGKIGYRNLFTESGVSVSTSTQAAAFLKENAYDGFGYDWWKPTVTGDSWIRAMFSSAKNANYMSITDHDLATQGSSVKPQYSTDGGSVWVDAASAIAPATNRALFFSFSTINAANWRMLVTNPTSISVIGGLQIGISLDLPKGMEVGFAPPSIVPLVTLKTAQSEKGAFIGGRKNSEGIKGSFTLTNIDPLFVRTDWQPFIAHVLTPRTFVFSWDDVNHSTEAVHAWVESDVPQPQYSNPLYMTISLNFAGNL